MLDRSIGIRFTTAEFLLLTKTCRLQGVDVSHFVRMSVRKELARLGVYSENVRQVLEVEMEAEQL